MEPATVIGSSSELYELVQELEQAQYLAIDTESNSFHAYYERICLIQISTTERDYIIDPLALKSIQPLKSLLANPRIEKIFHAASNDVSGLRRDFRFDINNLFDTALACKMLGYKQLGLAAVLEQYFGVQLNKKWQRHNWSKRPLTDEQINYARLDTHYLIPLRRLLANELNAGELWEQAQEIFHKACSQESQERMFQPDGFLRISGARSLDALGKSILQALYIYREQEARRRDRAPFRIFSNEALVRLAGHRPLNVKEFARVKGLPRFYRRGRAAYEILEIIRKIMENSIETDPAESVIPDPAQAAYKREKSPRR
jgi:ribonuclease D